MTIPLPAAPSSSRRRWPWAVGAVVLVVAVVAGGLVWRQRSAAAADRAAHAAVTAFATAWSAGRLSSVGYQGASGDAVQQQYATLVKGLGNGLHPTVTVTSQTRDGDAAAGRLAVRWTLPGGATWAYDAPVRLTRSSDHWLVDPTPAGGASLFAPVPSGSTLKLTRTSAPRADILGPDGNAIVTERPVVDVGVQPSRVKGDPGALAAKVAGIVDVQAASLAARVKAAKPDAFVDVITLRRSDYDGVRAKLRPLPGVVFRQRTQALAPTRDFARALIGTVGPVTAEIVKAGKGRYAAGDYAGISGLQKRYDAQLAGTAGVSIVATPPAGKASSSAADAKPVFSTEPEPGKPVTLTLDPAIQQAADAALAGVEPEAALVAVDVKTGAVLAVANNPSSGLNRAMVGRYPPGSTFKMVSTYALLGKGVTPTDTVNCPPTATVEGRTFRNYEKEKFGPVPFRTDFVKSCNTAFVGLSAKLDAGDLSSAARALGIGANWATGADAFSGDVPKNTSAVDKAAATFGQGRTLVSPLALAVATASVARGAYLPPSLVTDPKPTADADPGADLVAARVGTLQSLMRGVVTGGTGTALKSVPGGPVSAKTGTAEFGSDSPPKTHAWITGWQGDVAFTVFVDTGSSGGAVAGPVAARFLSTLAGH